MNLKKSLMGGVLAGLLAFATTSAWAVPLTLDITATGFSGATGWWDLDGPTSASDTYVTDYHTGFDILEGDYRFEIYGLQGGIGSTSWLLTVGGETVGGDSHGVFLVNVFKDKVRFSAATVPEPGTLGLVGAGLLGLGLIRRKRAAA